MKKLVVIILVLLFLPIVTASFEDFLTGLAILKPETGLHCYDDGSILIENIKKSGKVYARPKDSKEPYFPVEGNWESYETTKTKYFISDEAIFVNEKPTKYYIKIKKSRYSVTCPTFKFSCKILNMTIDHCYKRNDTFTAKFMAYNFPISKKKYFRFSQPYELWYEIKTKDGKKFEHSPDFYHKEFNEALITMKKLRKGDKFKLSWNTTYDIEKFSIRYQKCKRAAYFYATQECSKMPICLHGPDCLEDEICLDNVCQKLECEECQYAKYGKCYNYPCCDNDMCSFNEQCINQTCINLNCSENEAVINHQCSLLNCTEQEQTINHTCVKLECAEYEYAANHTCQLLICEDDEEIINHTCQKLKCGLLQKPLDHGCVNILSYIFMEKD